MLAVDDISIEFGSRILFNNLSLTINQKENWALAGPNGAGKSTLMKIIAGKEKPQKGKIIKSKQISIGYLPQEGIYHHGYTLFEEVEKAFGSYKDIQEQLDEIDSKLKNTNSKSENYQNLLENFGELQLELEQHDVTKIKPKIQKVLNGLGFSSKDLNAKTESFSGGNQMRIAMAKLLLQEPSVLLLDEPTNHLDIESIQWLEQWLNQYKGAIILISHDKTLLDNLTTKTLAFENGKTEIYSGNFSFYLSERKKRKEQAIRAAKNQEQEIKKTQKLISRFRSKATKAKMVQSRIKQLNKIEIIQIDEDDSSIDFKFPQPPKSGQSVIKIENLCKNYGDKHVIRNFDFEIQRNDKIAIVGVNGAGKSTFTKIISENEIASAGTLNKGHNVEISYFSQTNADELPKGKTVLEVMENSKTNSKLPINLRSILGAFLFKGDDVFKLTDILSGGERGRLALAKMLITPANFLILDEPTNHLDIQSQEVLQKALLSYDGTYIIVSHNRSFLDPIVTKVLEFIPNRSPILYYGNISDYIEKKKLDSQLKKNNPINKNSEQSLPSTKLNKKKQRQLKARARNIKNDKLNPLKKELSTLEQTIQKLEDEKETITKLLSDPNFLKDSKKFNESISELSNIELELENSYSKWNSISMKIEKIEKT